MKIYINRDSFGGSSEKKWLKVQPLLSEKLDPIFSKSQDLNQYIQDFLQSDENILLLGGGDGTFHHALNQLMNPNTNRPWKENLVLGGLSLGSSGSFLRSCEKAQRFSGIPGLLGNTQPWQRDIGLLEFTDSQGQRKKVYFLANGSIGFLAKANEIFNQASGILAQLKKWNTELANLWTFFLTLNKYSGKQVHFQLEGHSFSENLLNFQFLKAKFYAGSYLFERFNLEDSGLMDVHWFSYKNPWTTFKNFLLLSLNQEKKIGSHREKLTSNCAISASEEILIELDGEIYRGHDLRVTCLPRALRLCGGLE